MMETLIILFLLIPLVSLQTVVGVGVLVIGTPTLMILDYNIIEIFCVLLPVSITTSLINLLLIINKIDFNERSLIFIDLRNILTNFFFICLPLMTIGLIIITNIYEIIKIEFIVSFFIIFSLIIKKFRSKFFFKIIDRYKRMTLGIVGFFHGMTNTGGTLLSLILISEDGISKENYRLKMHFFYLLLAVFQLITLFLLNSNILKFNNYFLILPICGVIFGNLIVKKLDNIIIENTIIILASISSIFLITKNII